MKPTVLFVLSYLFAGTLFAQDTKYSSHNELRGNGKISREQRPVAPFRAVAIGPFLSSVTVDVGGTQSVVSVQIDDNLKPFLIVRSIDEVLTLDFKDPDNKQFWLSKGTIDITVKTPSLSQLRNESNGDVMINNLTGESFDLINEANGNVTLRGTVGQFNVVSAANGDIRAKELIARKASVITKANATVEVNTRQLYAQKSGHATIRNVAEKADRSATNVSTETSKAEEVTITLQNNSSAPRTVTLRFTEPGNPSYGVVSTTLGPYGKRRETYPVGTKIEQLDMKQTKVAMTGGDVRGKPIVTLTADDNGRTYNLPD